MFDMIVYKYDRRYITLTRYIFDYSLKSIFSTID